MSMVSEFKEFALKGNVMDLAVGIIIGAAFGKIVDSLVNDMLMPLVSKVIGELDFSNFFIKLAAGPSGVPQTLAELKKAGVPVLAYGNFITIVINFIILAFIIFLIVKQMNKIKRSVIPPAPPAPLPAPPEQVVLLTEIRDALKSRNN
ncbi:MAG: large conductance mechanosensitive channel protein MscL [Gallionellaceae bacterium]|nr:large conductance mechanosensitive channel protein MscL [Gallionellaceae bacterium]